MRGNNHLFSYYGLRGFSVAEAEERESTLHSSNAISLMAFHQRTVVALLLKKRETLRCAIMGKTFARARSPDSREKKKQSRKNRTPPLYIEVE